MSQQSPGSRERVWASGAPQLPHVVPSPPLVTNPSHSGAGAAGHLRDYTLDPYKGLRRPLGSPQLPSTCSELKRVGCPADSPAPSGAPLTTGCSQLLWAGTTHEPRLPLHLGDTPACQWDLGLPARRGPPDAASVAGRSCCHHPLQCTLCPQPGGCRLPSRSGPLEARVCLLPPPADLSAGCLVQGNLGPDCLHLSHNARFHSGPLALVHGGASCPPLPLENQRIQLEEFSGVLPHPPSPPSDGAGPVGGFSEGTPHPTGTLRLNPGPINLGAPPPVRASGQASQAAAHRGQLSWSPQVTGAVPVKTRGRRQEGWSCRQPWCKTAPCHQHPTTW